MSHTSGQIAGVLLLIVYGLVIVSFIWLVVAGFRYVWLALRKGE